MDHSQVCTTRMSVWGLMNKSFLSNGHERDEFGYTYSSQLATPTKSDRLDPLEVGMGSESLAFLSGSRDIYVYGWLKGLSHGHTGITKIEAPGAAQFVHVCSGSRHILALDAVGDAYIWSWDKLRPGQQLRFNFATGGEHKTPILKLSAGLDISAALIDNIGIAFWWQSDVENNTSNPLRVPYKLIPNTEIFPDHNDRIVDMTVGSGYIASVNIQGTLFVTRVTENGYTTLPDCNASFEKLRVGKYVSVHAFYDRLAAITENGELVLGRQMPSGQFVTQPVKGLQNICKVALGHFHTLAMSGQGEVFIWGDDWRSHGALGHGTDGPNISKYPRKLDLSGRAVHIAAEEYRSAVIVEV